MGMKTRISRPAIFQHAVLALLTVQIVGCEARWGDQELMGEIAMLRAVDIPPAVLEVPGRPATVLPEAVFRELLARIGGLEPAVTIGDVGPWSVFCTILFEGGSRGPLLIKVATRESLSGARVVTIRDRTGDNPRIGFYDGDPLYEWLIGQGLCGPESTRFGGVSGETGSYCRGAGGHTDLSPEKTGDRNRKNSSLTCAPRTGGSVT